MSLKATDNDFTYANANSNIVLFTNNNASKPHIQTKFVGCHRFALRGNNSVTSHQSQKRKNNDCMVE